jgi:uncharacterized protein (DUF302 family)
MTTEMTRTAYGFGTTVPLPYEAAIEKTKVALKQEGFGVLTEIDVKATLKEKIGADFERYIILGACNPQLAHRALQAEHEIGLLLPCNVIVHAHGDNETAVSVMDPQAALGIVGNDAIGPIANEARERLERAIAALAE